MKKPFFYAICLIVFVTSASLVWGQLRQALVKINVGEEGRVQVIDPHIHSANTQQQDNAGQKLSENTNDPIIAGYQENMQQSSQDEALQKLRNSQMPDLTILYVSVTDANGPDISFGYFLMNGGGAGTGVGPRQYIYLSKNTSLTGTYYKILEHLSAAVPAYDSTYASVSTTVSGVPTGIYYLLVYADGNGAIAESNENNNLGYDNSPLVYIPPPPMPDLVIRYVSVTDADGPDISFWYGIINQGGAGTGIAPNQHIFLSTNTALTGTYYKILEHLSSALFASDSTYESVSTTVSGIPTGSYYLLVYADGNGAIAESNENNNLGYDNSPLVNIQQPTPSVPNPPILESPPNGATGVSINPTLSWSSGGGPSVDIYRLKIRLESDEVVYDNPGITTTSVQVGPLDYDTKYYWRVKGMNSSGWGTYSDAFGFTTEAAPTTRFWADLDSDGDVDIIDIQLVSAHWNTNAGDPDYYSMYDVDNDGDIDIIDVQLVASWWNKPLPPL